MEIEQKIEVEFESNEKDFQRVRFWYHWKRMLLEYGLMIIIVISLNYFLGFNVLEIKNKGWIVFTFFATLSILLALDIYKRCFIQANKLKELAKSSKTIFSEQGIESKTSTTSSNRDWESYAKIYETAKAFIFFIRKILLQQFLNYFSKIRAKLKH